MDAQGILNSIKEAILAYAPLDSWCRLYYSKGVEVFVERYDYEPGDETLAPLVVVRREAKRQGFNRGFKELEVAILVKIQEEDASASAYDNLSEGEGSTRIDEFIEHLEGALSDLSLSDNDYIYGCDVEYHPAAQLGDWSAIMRLAIHEPVAIGTGIFA